MYKVQRQGTWEACEGRIVGVSDETLTVEDGAGRRGELAVSSVQGWVYDPTPARTFQESVTTSHSEEVAETETPMTSDESHL